VEIRRSEPLAIAAARKSRLPGLLQFRSADINQAEAIFEKGETRSPDFSFLNRVALESSETTFCCKKRTIKRQLSRTCLLERLIYDNQREPT
jgi:hypothetical protein